MAHLQTHTEGKNRRPSSTGPIGKYLYALHPDVDDITNCIMSSPTSSQKKTHSPTSSQKKTHSPTSSQKKTHSLPECLVRLIMDFHSISFEEVSVQYRLCILKLFSLLIFEG